MKRQVINSPIKFDVNPSTVQRIARPFDDAEDASVVTAA
jgi:hypothetical protein